MGWDDVVFTFPFEASTLIVSAVAYVATTPFITSKLNRNIQFGIWAMLAILFAVVFTIGYGPRFLLAVAMMMASRMRLRQKGLLKEVLMIVITLVVAMLFIGLR
ncbi:MAG: hypothetical protein FWG67_04890 [Defluviitaleaceae bacterium]|nr:hypothetical protein [Defluviitaleaceae bacterium]